MEEESTYTQSYQYPHSGLIPHLIESIHQSL